ncbi:MAG: hypothetical protein ACK5HY_03305, partial [Parahaliea sp.]
MQYSFVVTQDKKDLEQYYALREACFREDLGIPCFEGGEDEYDREGTVLLALDRDRRVLAGARIYGRRPGQHQVLPIECQQFCLRECFPALELNRRPYCHWGRLVISHSVRNSSRFAQDLLQRLISCSAQLGYDFAFLVSDRCRCRYYRQIHSMLGYDFHISDVEPPTA